MYDQPLSLLVAAFCCVACCYRARRPARMLSTDQTDRDGVWCLVFDSLFPLPSFRLGFFGLRIIDLVFEKKVFSAWMSGMNPYIIWEMIPKQGARKTSILYTMPLD